MKALWEPRQLMWWVYLAAIVVGAVYTYDALKRSAVGVPHAMIAGGLYAVVLGWILLWILSKISAPGLPRASVVVLCLGWGVLVAPPIAIAANGALTPVYNAVGLSDWSASFSAPVTEEGGKVLGVVVVLYLTRALRPTVLTGFLYGAIIGVGFEVLENCLYTAISAVNHPVSDAQGITSVVISRSLFGVGAHMLFTAISGAAIAYALTRVGIRTSRRVVVAAGGFLLPVVLHGVWDAPAGDSLGILLLSLVLKAAVFIGAIAIVVMLGRGLEHPQMRSLLAGESPEVVSSDELDALVSGKARRRQLQATKVTGGRRAKRQLVHRFDAQYALADLLLDHDPGDEEVERRRSELRASSQIDHRPAKAGPTTAVAPDGF